MDRASYTACMATSVVSVRTPLKVYLSYTQHDVELARRLADCMAEHGFDPWLDDAEVALGDNWALRSGEALRDADALVVLVSPESPESQQMKFELNYALGERRFAGRLVPILIDDASADALPWILTRFPIVRAANGQWDAACTDVMDALRAAAAERNA